MGRNGSGVRAASDTTIEITFTYQGTRCRERIRLQPTPANLKRAARHKAAIEAAIEGGTFDYAVTFPESTRAKQFARCPGDVTPTGTFLAEWLLRVEPTLAASTYADYKKTVNGPLAAFAAKKLTEIDQAELEDFCAKLKCGNKRIGNILSVLRIALDNAKDRKQVSINPVAGFSYTRNEPPKETDDIDPFSMEERAAILRVLDGQAYNLVQVAFWSGLRTSELVALDWRRH
ncbi:MAG: DUF3596 domain-containing protein [Rhodocyclaceae bacterium]|nr:DUF3596 domain-containing protein [Rhodocyclaceae bacterium]